MNIDPEVPDGNRPTPERSIVARLAFWLMNRIGLNRDGLTTFAEQLLTSFQVGLLVIDPDNRLWYATLDAIDPEDNQVAALVRLSIHPPKGNCTVRRGMVDDEVRNEEVTFVKASSSSATDSDLLLTYSFPLLLTLQENLDLFREFARNELGRLRAPSHSVG